MQNRLETPSGHQLSQDNTFLVSGTNESSKKLHNIGALQLAVYIGGGGREGGRAVMVTNNRKAEALVGHLYRGLASGVSFKRGSTVHALRFLQVTCSLEVCSYLMN